MCHIHSSLFQSTQSLRTATIAADNVLELCSYFNPRSPCGLRPKFVTLGILSMNFNPRSPCGLRQISICDIDHYIAFQSTQSLRTATIPQSKRGGCRYISIHAVLADCDKAAMERAERLDDFNPRSPCGLRL